MHPIGLARGEIGLRSYIPAGVVRHHVLDGSIRKPLALLRADPVTELNRVAQTGLFIRCHTHEWVSAGVAASISGLRTNLGFAVLAFRQEAEHSVEPVRVGMGETQYVPDLVREGGNLTPVQ